MKRIATLFGFMDMERISVGAMRLGTPYSFWRARGMGIRLAAGLMALAVAAPVGAQQRVPNTNPRSLAFYTDYSMVAGSVSNSVQSDISIANYFIRAPDAPRLKLNYAINGSAVGGLENMYSMPVKLTVAAAAAEPAAIRILNLEGMVAFADAVLNSGEPYTIRFEHGGAKRIIVTATTPDGRMNYEVVRLNIQEPEKMMSEAMQLLGDILPAVELFERSIVNGCLDKYRGSLYQVLSAAHSFEELDCSDAGQERREEAVNPEPFAADISGRLAEVFSGGHNPVLDYKIEAADPFTHLRASDDFYRDVEVRGVPARIRIETGKIRDAEDDPVVVFRLLLREGNLLQPIDSKIMSPGFTDYLDISEPGSYGVLVGAVCDMNKASLRLHRLTVIEAKQ